MKPKLAGLPPTAVAAARARPKRKGREGWRFTLQAPQLSRGDDLSGRLPPSANRSGEPINRARAAERPLRQPPAHREDSGTAPAKRRSLLGFADFADLVLEDRMAHTGERAQAFLADLRAKTEKRFREENRELEAFAGPRRSSPGTSAITPKSSAPRSTISTKKRCARTSRWSAWWPECSRSSGRVFGIRVKEEPGVPVWDPQVQYYEIHDRRSAELSRLASTPTGFRAKTSAAAPGWTR